MYKHGYDFAIRNPKNPEQWIAMDWPKGATHKIVATSFADPEPEWRRKKTEGLGKANHTGPTAVCAIPLIRRYEPSKLIRRIKRPLPRWQSRWPLYKTDASLSSKRNTILEYASLTGSWRRYRIMIRLADHQELDRLLKEFIKASRFLRHEWSKKPQKGTVASYWKRRAKEEPKQAQPPPQPVKKPGLLDNFSKSERAAISMALTELVRGNQIKPSTPPKRD